MRCLNAGEDHWALVQLREDSKQADFRALYRRRAPVIEGVFAEAKQRHGLRRAWRRGLSKMKVQCLLVAAVLNFKRLATVFWTYFAQIPPYKTFLKRLQSILRALISEYLQYEHRYHNRIA